MLGDYCVYHNVGSELEGFCAGWVNQYRYFAIGEYLFGVFSIICFCGGKAFYGCGAVVYGL